MSDDDGKRVNIGVRLLPATIAALDAAGDRMGGKSRAFAIEVLTALYASQLNAETVIPAGMMPPGSRSKGAGGRHEPAKKSRTSGRAKSK